MLVRGSSNHNELLTHVRYGQTLWAAEGGGGWSIYVFRLDIKERLTLGAQAEEASELLHVCASREEAAQAIDRLLQARTSQAVEIDLRTKAGVSA